MGVLAFFGFLFGILGVVAFVLVIRLRKTMNQLREDIDTGNLQGPKGDKGDRGEKGEPGPKGDKGDKEGSKANKGAKANRSPE
jgi:hypothetical protein